ncbi:Phosphoserine aminotransferase [Candidatus Terasakiella magnetica]|uniref:phosphoserine transaminase n=1 Tax=Candidatus Terasakiella magnetica TaxID=1867952 RepID=A0A1C3RJN0_9PROT|nr:phosphoserine transaminase [Candidatus Terasakiella magnetica]SCA57437.1 Phosphoserine aminotransferase [Candidatus Terasakiella magnetica]
MTTLPKPSQKPDNPNFSSGPCSKRPGYDLSALKDAPLGRSHRAKIGKEKLGEVIERTKAVLGIPADYRVAIVPASDTGAVEMSLWSLLGARGVDMLAWESFGKGWVNDVQNQLKLNDVRVLDAPYGELPDLAQVDFSRDVVFTWNGTTSGVRVPNGDWIEDQREGLTIVDATSAVFAMDIPWEKVDVLTYSWQKVMGGEGAHGMLVLSPRAVERLESYTPAWPLPKIFRMTKGGKLIEGIFTGATINTPSMLCVEDALDGLKWAKSLGGLSGLIKRSQDNLAVMQEWVAKTAGVEFLAKNAETRSSTSVCLKITADWFVALSEEDQAKAAKRVVALLDEQEAAYDIGAYKEAPVGLRIWCGATVEASDLKLLTPWIDWALAEVSKEF